MRGLLPLGMGRARQLTARCPARPSPRGPEWGDKGYIRLRRNRGDGGQCGIAMQASFPIKKGPNPPEPPPAPPGPSPPPGPAPEDCDDTTQCPADNTCCCMREFFG